MEMTRNLDWNM